MLKRHGLSPADIDCYAGGSGPGSFTGVRVALACIKGLAHATGKLAAGISNLEAVASFGSAPLRAALLDARRGEVYGAVYDAEGKVVIPETVGRLVPWLESVPQGEVEVIGIDLSPFASALSGFRATQAPRAQAAAVGRIAYRRLLAGEAQDPSEIDANYVRRSDAELLWKE
jgi:tRNA threonylcarbamoyladenosine biosynthesis protein TsaB